MEIRLLFKALGFILLLLLGIPGNVFILLKFTYIKCIEKKLIPANIILMILALANLLVVLSRIIPQTLDALGVENLLEDIECKISLHTYRVSRAMSICLTTLLSCHQCMLIAPATRYWIYFKTMITQNIFLIVILLLGMNMSVYSSSILFARKRTNSTTSPYTLHLVYCDIDFLTYVSYFIYGMASIIREVFVVGLMTLSSSYMVSVLHRHGKSMKGMRSSDRGQSKTVEYKAARAVILLVSLYVVLFGIDNSMWIYSLSPSYVTPIMNETRIFLAASFSALSPIVIIATNPKLHQGVNNQCKKLTQLQKGDTQKRVIVNCVSQNLINNMSS
ncbi:olfactory receptor class A-like protein 1 [Ascaphus truei]|uniref:olfactory receptor class A-like protein 1 n=1 Tax=Ascaphus truei TaxID=8439 RepID=UPI003F590BB0